MMDRVHRAGHGYQPLLVTVASLLALATSASAQSAGQIARSDMGVVVAAQPLAAAAGVRMLEMGGNAADAAVAAAFAIAVVEPSMNSIGGRNQILIRLPAGEVRGIDGTTTVPPGYDPETAPRTGYGYATVGVPGAVAGLMRLHDEHGSLPLDDVMAPAIDYAESGFRVLPGEARRQAGSRSELAETEGASRYFLKPDGSSYAAGDLLVQRDLAAVLREIARGGRDGFYSGSIATTIAGDMEANGGFVTRAALEGYEAEDSRIVRGTYRGFEIVGSDMPASGAVAIQALQIAERFDPREVGPEAWAAIVGQSIALALEDYVRLGSDSAAARATSKEWAARQAARVAVPGLVRGAGDAGAPALAFAPSANGTSFPPPEGHTTHLSVADREGMAVALTQTIGPSMGARVATPGLGFLYAVTLGGYLGISEEGERARSGITPLMVSRDGEPVLVLGAAGGIRIISAVVQAVIRVVDDGLSLPEALAAPRIHPDLNVRTGELRGLSIEAAPDDGWSDDALTRFEELGISVVPTRRRGAFGRIHALHFDAASGVWTGAADPDWEGAALAPSVDRRR